VIFHKLHGNAFEGTNLREELEKRDVSVVITTGLVTHGCVRATCLGAMNEGFQVVLVSDGHSSYSKDAAQLIEKWNRALGENGAEVIEAGKVCQFRFEAWFAGSGGVDSIVECVGRRVRLRRPDTMTSRIETATDEFVDDMERFLLDREMIS
jgi:hypothetical protein